MLTLSKPDELQAALVPLLAEPRTATSLAEALEARYGSRPCKPVVYKWLAALKARGLVVKSRKVRQGKSGPAARAYYVEAVA